jgi:hypothetical protein
MFRFGTRKNACLKIATERRSTRGVGRLWLNLRFNLDDGRFLV